MSVRRRAITTALAALAVVGLTAGCSSSGSPSASGGGDVHATPDAAYLKDLGWQPMDNSLPNFACTDSSYADAVKNGIKLGIYSAAPYEYMENGKPAGLDWDINMAVLKYIGVKKYTTVTLQWDGMIPALKSNRIDVITGNIHQTADRLKNMAFTAPAWWYGSTLLVQKGNPAHIASWNDLTKPGVKVGVVNGSQSQTYLNSIKAQSIAYEDANSEFASLVAGREDVVVDDSPKEAAYIQAHPDSNLQMLEASDLPPAELIANYARYGVRPSDCTLNAAYSRALSELRDHGVITKILAKYGLTDNLYEPQYKP